MSTSGPSQNPNDHSGGSGNSQPSGAPPFQSNMDRPASVPMGSVGSLPDPSSPMPPYASDNPNSVPSGPVNQ